MNFHVIYRLSDKPDSTNGLPRPFGLKKFQIIDSCIKSLIRSFRDTPWAMTIVADDITEETRKFVKEVFPKHFDVVHQQKISKDDGRLPFIDVPFLKLDVPYNNNYVRLLEFDSPLKSYGSMMKGYEVADMIQDEETWIYFLEDDYMHDHRTFLPRLEDFSNFANQYKFALPIFIHPSDYPDQYTRLLTRCYIFQTNFGYWREVCSTTGTFMCQAKTYKKFSSFFKSCGNDDGKLSTIFKKQAFCFSPMPGFATHCHEGVMSNYVDWATLIKENLAV